MKGKSLILIILAILLGMGLGVGGTLGLQKIFVASAQSSDYMRAAQKEAVLLPIGEFTVNLQGGSFLMTKITVQVVDAKAQAELKEKEAFLQDRVNSVLVNKSLADVQTTAAREKLKEELLKNLNQVAGNKINDVLFLSWVYQ
ncbi:MAG: flagellar basal body-associated FliL family protein [Desulfosporosinus sp.]|jgi:flagellar FliL protein